jgi:hypothetical protein
MIAVEVLISKATVWATFQPQVQKLLTWLNTSFAFGCCVVGVSNCVSGTPALEKCHEYCEFLFDNNDKIDSETIYLIASEKVQLLGFDPTREPDAGSGVFQVVCTDLTSQGYTYKEWLQTTKSQLFVNEWMEVEEKEQERKAGLSNDPELFWVLLGGILVAIIAAYVHIVFVKK